MKLKYTVLILLICFSFMTTASATVLSGRVNVIGNNGNNFKVLLQINTDTLSRKLGGATFVVNFDSTLLSFPSSPVMGTDYIFTNFNLGFYDTAKVTKAKNNQLWINIVLESDNHGTLVQQGPDSWTDLVVLNFTSNQVISDKVIFWDPDNKYWHVYDEDNATTWNSGYFDNITYSGDGKFQVNQFSYVLNQNYPNPFNPSTTIQYNVPQQSYINLTVYNIIGQRIAVLVDGEKDAGFYSLEFNAAGLPSGIYIYRLQSSAFTQTRKMILLK
ncbi:MAG TPA: T9SS type A sorting domain-containing protein [Ignavibacteriaceae bacterium]|nr:T9SS type A sorting domain-containing protein [Ignavibacteriaceae bacterium]